MIIQKVAPGPPMDTAMATPAILPSPTVADNAVVNAWKGVTSPSSSGREYFPLNTRTEWPSNLRLMKPIRTVRKTAPAISQATINGIPYPTLKNRTFARYPFSSPKKSSKPFAHNGAENTDNANNPAICTPAPALRMRFPRYFYNNEHLVPKLGAQYKPSAIFTRYLLIE